MSDAAAPLTLLPDTERIVSVYLRAHPAVAELVGDRVYTAMPADAGDQPFLTIQRVGGTPPHSRPLWLDQAQLQLDAWGGRKREAWLLAETVRQALVALPGRRDGGTVSACEFGGLRWMPDGTFKPPRPRYLFDAFIYDHPAGALVRVPAAPERLEEVR